MQVCTAYSVNIKITLITNGHLPGILCMCMHDEWLGVSARHFYSVQNFPICFTVSPLNLFICVGFFLYDCDCSLTMVMVMVIRRFILTEQTIFILKLFLRLLAYGVFLSDYC